MSSEYSLERMRQIQRSPVRPDEVPAPYNDLLVHDHDMTSTLAAFHQSEILLKVLEESREGDSYTRTVILNAGDKPVEYGWITIHLDAFPEASRALILEGKKPLGWILENHGLTYLCDPFLFFTVDADETLQTLLSTGPGRLYGRENRISNPDGHAMAEVIEILPA